MSGLPGDQLQSAPPERYWWIAEGDKPKGPYHEAYLVAAIRIGVFHSDDQACPENGTVWKSLEDWPAFAPACAAASTASAALATPDGPAVAAGPGASSVLPPPPPRGTAAKSPVPQVAAAGPQVPRFSLTPLAGLIVGGTVGAVLGLAIGGLIGVGMQGGCLMGAITGALAGALAARNRKSDNQPPPR